MSIFTRSAEAIGEANEHFIETSSATRSRSRSDSTGEVSIVGRGVRIEGDIHVDGDVRVGGRINGAVHVTDRIVVASDGVILGGIRSGEGDIAGTVEGDVVTSGTLVIRKTASVLGQITADQLVVEEGAAISGTCRIGSPSRVEPVVGGESVGDGAQEGAPTLLPLE